MKDMKLRSNLLLQLVENAQVGIVASEKEGRDTILIYVNSAFEKLTGYTHDEILYQDCRFLQNDDRDQDAVRAIRQAIDKGEAVTKRLRNYRKDGSLFWNELTITPYYDEVDKVTYFIGIQKDVTAEVKLQQELEQANERIAELEAQLTARSAG